MTAEALSNLKTLKTISQAKFVESGRDLVNTNETFSNHLTTKQDKATQTGRDRSEKLNRQQSDHKNDAADERAENRKNIARDQRQTSTKRADQQRARDENATVERQNPAEKSDHRTQEPSEGKKTDSLETAKETNKTSNEDQASATDETTEATQITAVETALSEETFSNNLNTLQEEQLTTEASNTAIAAGIQPDQIIEQQVKQSHDNKTTINDNLLGDKTAHTPLNNLKSNKAGGDQNGNGLASTLGQETDTEGANSEKANTAGKNFSELVKTLKEAGAQKDLAQTLNAQNGAQNQPPHAPILANGQHPANNPLKANIFQQTEGTKIQPIDGVDSSTSVTNSPDTKNITPASQLRAAGYTSPTQSIALSIAQKAQNGLQQFEIRLNPPELGRVNVRLEFGKDGQVTTHLIVERPETLDLLNKDARQLERALTEAGVKIENDGLSFSLKEQDTKESDQDQSANGFEQSASSDEEINEITPAFRRITGPNGLDISI